MKSGLTRAITATLLAFATYGCIMQGNYEDGAKEPIVGCSSNAQCPSNALCTLGACLGEAVPRQTYRMRLSTTQSSPVKDLDVNEIQFDSLAFLELETIEVPPPLKTTGSVRFPNGSRIEADIIAVGSNDSSRIERLEAIRYLQGDQPSFVLYLPTVSRTMGGSTRPLVYDMAVIPTNDGVFPPLKLSAVAGDSITPPYFISLPSENDRFTVAGSISFNGSDNLPVSGLQVMVVDEDEQRISTIAQTTVLGQFSVDLWSDNLGDSATLVVQDQRRRLPKLRRAIDLGDGQEPVVVPPIILGLESSLFDFSGSVIGEGPMAGASVSMVSLVGDGILSPSIPTTRSGGMFYTQLFTGEYLVQVVPPITSPFGMLRIKANLSSTSSLILRPPLKGTFRGILKDTDGKPIANAGVDATLLVPNFGQAELMNPHLPMPSRVSHTTTDAQGVFELQLEPGQYEYRFKPPIRSGLPSFTRNVSQPRNIGALQPTEFVTPLSAVIIAQFDGPQGEPLRNELIQLWDQTSGDFVTSGRTNDTGTVLLRVPVDEDRE